MTAPPSSPTSLHQAPVLRGGRGPNTTGWWVLGIGAAVLLLLVTGGWWLTATRLPPGTQVAGQRVTTRDAARDAAATAAAALADLPVRLTTAAGSSHETTVAALGVVADPSGLVDLATGPGAWLGALTSGAPRIPLAFDVPPAAVLGDAAAALDAEPRNGMVRATATGPAVTEPRPGARVAPAALREALRGALDTIAADAPDAWPRPLAVDVPADEVPPAIGERDVAAAVAALEEVVGADVEVRTEVPSGPVLPGQPRERESVSVPVNGPQVMTLFAVEPQPGAPPGRRLQVRPDPERAPAALNALLERAAYPPTLDIRVEDRSPTPGRGEDVANAAAVTGTLVARPRAPGFAPDPTRTVEAIIAAARSGRSSVAVAGDTVNPASVTPADLGITRAVSTFTTFYTPGQSRVTNIHRIAEIVDGTLIPPDTNYELNHAVGERTRERGFVQGGAILDGEFVTDVGGGVSQFGTTFFNAAWFAGVELVEFQPHSFYFERYPAGREATIDFPNVNLEIRNDTPHWILVDTAVTDDSVTVTFWSTPYWDVETITGNRIPAGEGFRITVDRVRTSPDGRREQESYTTRYRLP